MKKVYSILLLVAGMTFAYNSAVAQTTAMNFSGPDCNGNQVDLFSDLDAGKAVMLIFYMPNCGSCPPVATKMQTMANNINATHPGLVKAYAFPYQNSTTCAYSASWVTNNNLPLFAPMDSGAVQVAYYGGFGMPTVVLLGGSNHDVLFTTQNFVTADTTTMRDLILNTFTAGTQEITENSAITAYPNPASDLLTVSFTFQNQKEAEVELLDLAGKRVIETEKVQIISGLAEKQLNVSGIPVGTYIVRITAGDYVSTHQVTIRR